MTYKNKHAIFDKGDRVFVFDWASYMQIELKSGEDKTQKIRDLLSAYQKYYHGCIIYVNNENAAKVLKKKIDDDT
jgi:regulator of RNase E activity RraB